MYAASNVPVREAVANFLHRSPIRLAIPGHARDPAEIHLAVKAFGVVHVVTYGHEKTSTGRGFLSCEQGNVWT